MATFEEREFSREVHEEREFTREKLEKRELTREMSSRDNLCARKRARVGARWRDISSSRTHEVANSRFTSL